MTREKNIQALQKVEFLFLGFLMILVIVKRFHDSCDNVTGSIGSYRGFQGYFHDSVDDLIVFAQSYCILSRMFPGFKFNIKPQSREERERGNTHENMTTHSLTLEKF